MKLTKDKQGLDEMDQLIITIINQYKEHDNLLTLDLLQKCRKNIMSFIFDTNK